FLEPSFTAEHGAAHAGAAGHAAEQTSATEHAAAGSHGESGEHASRVGEIGLMGFSLLIAILGIAVAYAFYVKNPDIPEQLGERFAGAHKLLLNKYYVDEVYDATVISGTFKSGRGLWAVDRNVVDGAVNGTGMLTQISSYFSGWTDRTFVDGL